MIDLDMSSKMAKYILNRNEDRWSNQGRRPKILKTKVSQTEILHFVCELPK